MKELYIRTAAQKAALVEAVEHHIEVVSDEIGEMCADLAEAEGWEFEVSLSNIQTSRKELAFLTSFKTALVNAPVGNFNSGCFLETFEVGVIRTALASMVDIKGENNGNETILAVVSSENIKNTIRSTAREWGAIDPERLAIELSRQARQALEGNSAAKDLLDQLT